jgi:hypothetical protein
LTTIGWATFWAIFSRTHPVTLASDDEKSRNECFAAQYKHSKLHQGCQMVCFQTKNPNLGKFCGVLQWKMLVYFTETWFILLTVFCNILWTFGTVRGNLVIFPVLVFCTKKIWQP